MAQISHTANQLLASLGADKIAGLLPRIKVLELPQETVLFETGDTIKTVYFPVGGLVSIVVDLATGETIETAMIGKDGLVGGSAALDNPISLNRAVVQVAGAAATLPLNHFRELVQESPSFRAKLARHEQFLLAQAQQAAACNATHSLEERLSRWLLRCHDLVGGDLPLTQEFLAEMLGVRRTSVTLAAQALQQAGLIEYRSGHVQLLNLDGLQESTCECYATIKAHGTTLLAPSQPA
jgi:CRP-like cAMP-binding protein